MAAPTRGIYEQRFSAEDPRFLAWRRGVWRALVDDFFARWIATDAAVLDYGCGLGEFINAVRCARRIGVDARGDARLGLDPGVEFVQPAELRLPTLPDGSIDVVFCSNLLEHLPDRPAVTRLLREFARILRPTGRLLVLGPNLRFTGPAYWDFFDHVLPFTHVSLVEALATADFSAELVIPRFLPYTTVGARRTPLALVRAYLRLPLLWRLLGAQFFVVARSARASEARSEAKPSEGRSPSASEERARGPAQPSRSTQER